MSTVVVHDSFKIFTDTQFI